MTTPETVSTPKAELIEAVSDPNVTLRTLSSCALTRFVGNNDIAN